MLDRAPPRSTQTTRLPEAGNHRPCWKGFSAPLVFRLQEDGPIRCGYRPSGEVLSLIDLPYPSPLVEATRRRTISEMPDIASVWPEQRCPAVCVPPQYERRVDFAMFRYVTTNDPNPNDDNQSNPRGRIDGMLVVFAKSSPLMRNARSTVARASSLENSRDSVAGVPRGRNSVSETPRSDIS